MSREMGRDDFVISARSVFLKKRNRQKFSLLTLIIMDMKFRVGKGKMVLLT